MIVNFSIKNYKSIKEKAVLSMVSSSLKETFDTPSKAVFGGIKSLKLLPLATIYGSNASGKSNLIESMLEMKFFVQSSLAKENVQDKIPVEPFMFSPDTKHKPTEFEISFLSDKKIFRYGYTATKDEVYEEWLYEKELKDKAKEKEIFYRGLDSFDFHPVIFRVGKIFQDQNLIKKNVLLLSLAYQLNDDISREVMNWFLHFNVLSGHGEEDFDYSMSQIQQKTDLEQDIQELIRFADVGINKLSHGTEFDGPEIFAHHTIYDNNNHAVDEYMLILSKQESKGTKKLFSLSGPVFSSLKHGKVLVVDEMDSHLHPNLMERLVLMFQDLNINKNGAQLIFASHNTNLLGAKLLRRDQIWITEKNKYGATRLYSVAEFKTERGKARNTEAIETNYIDGKYGGTPFLGELDNFIESYSHEQKGSE
jgi:AAA15 family ATPase/GTPase